MMLGVPWKTSSKSNLWICDIIMKYIKIPKRSEHLTVTSEGSTNVRESI
jgi:hypothetical protein